MNSIILEMCKSKFAHFFVMKMLKYGKKEQKLIIVKEMEGKIAKVRIFYFSYQSRSYTERESLRGLENTTPSLFSPSKLKVRTLKFQTYYVGATSYSRSKSETVLITRGAAGILLHLQSPNMPE